MQNDKNVLYLNQSERIVHVASEPGDKFLFKAAVIGKTFIKHQKHQKVDKASY